MSQARAERKVNRKALIGRCARDGALDISAG
jgi:hypothetical protein